VQFNNLIFEPVCKRVLHQMTLVWSSFICSSSFQVDKLVLIGASVYAEGTGKLTTLPRAVAYAGVNISPT